ncbi:MAG TPA: DUF5723 family protein [Cytophagaceae bacterium]|jgi:hypothetical protein
MKKVLAGIFLLFANQAISQIDIASNERFFLEKKNLYLRQGENKGLIGLSVNYNVNSNTIDNSFLRQALYKGYIQEDVKTNTLGELKEKNRAGLTFYGGLFGAARKGRFTFTAALSHNEYFAAASKPDFIKLVFGGNKQFEDKHAEIGNTSVRYFNYQSLSLGLHKQIEGKNLIVGGGVSLVRGGSFQDLTIKRGDFYTAPGGDFIEFDTEISMSYSSKDARALPKSNGIGAGLNFSLATFTEKSSLNFEIKDFGFISWNGIENYRGDAAYRFEGIRVKNIFQANDSIFTGLNPDSLSAQLGIKKSSEKMTTTLPTQFRMNYTHLVSEKFTIGTGINYLLSPAYIPRIYLKPIYNFNNNLSIIPTIAYGGFGGLDFELGVVKSFNDKFLVSANIFYLEYLLASKSSSGHGFNLNMFKTF